MNNVKHQADRSYYRALLAKSEWLQRLARALVADKSHAEDLCQHTLLEALKRPPARRENLRGWLTAVAKNAARKMARASRNRRARERRVAKGEILPPAPLTHDQELLRKRIGDLVLHLKEPYRTAIVLRYFEELTPQQIAARLELPMDTVYTHLHRGLGQLRVRLDSHYRVRNAWVIVLVPLARVPNEGSRQGSRAVTRMTPKASMAAMVAVLTATLPTTILLLAHDRPDSESAVSAPADHVASPETESKVEKASTPGAVDETLAQVPQLRGGGG